MKRSIPSEKQVEAWLYKRSNWGRWGKDDQLGAMNLITPKKRLQAAAAIRSGDSLCLSLPIPKAPGGMLNPRPAAHYFRGQMVAPRYYASADYIGLDYHGFTMTHMDAICHYWGPRGMWQGRDPLEAIGMDGAKWGTVEHWRLGFTTRGVLLDVPRFRGKPYVDADHPVHGDELEAIAEAQGIEITPGDALVVYGGREAWDKANPKQPYVVYGARAPGLHASCLPFIRDNDVSILVWDMQDARPSGYRINAPIHGVLFAYGVALVDNATLVGLAGACAKRKQYDFMLTVAPLYLEGGTGSPVNPIAIL